MVKVMAEKGICLGSQNLNSATSPERETAHGAGSLDIMCCTQAYQRLIKHLKGAGLYEGETPHSSRRGGVQDMMDSGAGESAVGARMLVKTPAVVRLYNSRCRPTRQKPLAPATRKKTPAQGGIKKPTGTRGKAGGGARSTSGTSA
jgi:hypothetical protein